MRVVIIGGTGHVGTYLVPRLVQAGYEVINVSRGSRRPYLDHAAWAKVKQVQADRVEEDAAGSFGRRIAGLQPDIVIDMVCFTRASAEQMVGALRGRVQHFVHCGSVWIHGAGVVVPIPETAPRRPIGDYGTQKAEIEAFLLKEARQSGFPVTLLHPGHIVGRGWVPVNPQGNFNPRVFEQLAHGEEVMLPHFGLETLQHVHADDVACGFLRAIENRNRALGESFHIATPTALTWRGYAESVATWFGREAHLRFLPWKEWRARASDEDAHETDNHLTHSTFCDVSKAQAILGYKPRYSPLEAIFESLEWLIAHGMVKVERCQFGPRSNDRLRKDASP